MSSQKHEILFSRFHINYNELPARFRKGSILVREEVCPGDRYERYVLTGTRSGIRRSRDRRCRWNGAGSVIASRGGCPCKQYKGQEEVPNPYDG